MVAYSEDDRLRLAIGRVLRHEQSFEALAHELGEVLVRGDAPELAWEIEILLDEWSAGHWRDAELVEQLRQLVENVVVDLRPLGFRSAASAPLVRLDLRTVVN